MAPAKDEVVLGVDLGTTNSAVAVFRDDSVEVLTNDIDKRTTPSCVYVRDSERQVGEAALRLAASFPANTVRNVKSILGRPILPKGEAPLGPVTTRGAALGKAFTIVINNTENATLFSPEEIAAMLLLELKKAAEQHLQTEVGMAVLAVPSYFTASQRCAITDAAELAGLRVPHLLNETTAAAMAYAFDREDEKTVLMVDVGGGGSSAAVVKVALNQVEVVAHSGVRLPGGEDFDVRMMLYLAQCVKRDLQAEDLDARDCEILRAQWTKAKEKLSRIPQVTINIFLPGVGQEFRCDMKRADFEEECAELFKSIADGLLATLDRAEVKPEQLDEVVLVGGSSRIPYLRNLVQQLVKDKPLCKAINPDEAVAKGAALMAAKRVQLKQEVLSLKTRIRMGHGVVTVLPNTKLPYQITPVVDASIEIHQNIGPGNAMLQIFDSRLLSAHLIGIYQSGIIQIGNSLRQRLECRFDGCLPPAEIKPLLKKMQRHKEKETEESQRVQGKNALEDLLRHVLGLEIPDDSFRDDLVALREKCEEKLQWLNENGNRPFAEYDNKRMEIEDALNNYNAKREVERARVEAREELYRTLQEIQSNVKGLNDQFDERVTKLHKRCKDKLVWMHEHPDASKEEYIRSRDKFATAADEIQEDRIRLASDLRKVEVRKTFESRIKKTLQPTMDKEGPDDALFKSYCHSLKQLCEDESEWLRSSKCSRGAEERELTHRLQAFEAQAEKINREYRSNLKAAEQRRVEAFQTAERKVLEALNLQVSQGHPAYEDAEALRKSCRKRFKWLQHNLDASTKILEKITESVDTKIATLEHKRVEEEQRLNSILTLEIDLTDGLQEFSNDPLLVHLERCCRGQLLERQPRPSIQDLGRASAVVKDVLGLLRLRRDNWLKQQEAARAAADADQQATAAVGKLAAELGCPGLPSPQPAAEQTVCSRVSWTHGVSSRSAEQSQPQWGHPDVAPSQPAVPTVSIQVSWIPGVSSSSSAQAQPQSCHPELAPTQPAVENASSKAPWTPGVVSLSSSTQAYYQPIEYTSGALDADKMEVDSEGRDDKGANGHVRGPENVPMANVEAASDPRERPGRRQAKALNGTKQSTRRDHARQLQSAAEDVARTALEEARAAGRMALIVDREAAAEHDLLSLSVRFLQDSGDAVERLLLVRDARGFSESPDELVGDTWARFEELCRSVSLDVGRSLEYLSACGCGPFGPPFVKLFKERLGEDGGVVVASTAVPLDERVVAACYECCIPKATRKDIDVLGNFFTVVDNLRQAPTRGCKSCAPGLLGHYCGHPWRTYSSSIAFLLQNREKLASTPEVVVQCDPDEQRELKNVMNNTKFLVCLAAFGEVFSELQKVSQLVVDFDMDFKEYWTGLNDCMRAFSSPVFTDRVKVAADQVTPINGIPLLLVRVIIAVAHNVVCAARTDFKLCNEILQCLVSEDNQPRGSISKLVSSDLVSFKRLHSSAISDSPQRVLGRVHRSEFEKHYPTLYMTLQHALTAPLLPPTGPRSDQQLREGVRRTAGISEDLLEAAVVVEGSRLSFNV